MNGLMGNWTFIAATLASFLLFLLVLWRLKIVFGSLPAIDKSADLDDEVESVVMTDDNDGQ